MFFLEISWLVSRSRNAMLLLNPIFHHRVDKCQPLDPNFGQLNPAPTLTPYFCDINFDSIPHTLQSIYRSPFSLPLSFPDQNSEYVFLFPYVYYISRLCLHFLINHSWRARI